MKKALSVMLVSTALAASTMVSAVSPASAATPRCATFQEFRQVNIGMKKVQVHRILDFAGQFADGAGGGYTRYYGSCRAVRNDGGDSGAFITYDGPTNKVAEKRWIG